MTSFDRSTDPHRSKLILLPFLRLTSPTDGLPWDYLRKILLGAWRSQDGQGEEILAKASTPE